MKFGYKCSSRKLLSGIPGLFSLAAIFYIAYIFAFKFLPITMLAYYWTKLFITTIFYYFFIMTLVSITTTALSDPGYLSLEYQHPLTN